MSSAQSNAGIFFNISAFFLLLLSSSISPSCTVTTAFKASSSSYIMNAVRKFAITFQIPSGNGPDWVSFHSNSIHRSLALHCVTVLSDIVGDCGCVVICCAVCVVCANRF
jgi:hypothetical protein